MKRMGKKLLTCILMALCALCLVLAACGEEDKIEFSFETNGGPAIETVYVDKGETYTLPTPQREGFDFEGWYDNAELSGTAVTEVVAENSTKYYAKWEQLYEIKLELDGGTLATGKLYAKTGAAIYDTVKDLVPTKDGWLFGAWYLGDAELSRAAQIGEADVTLTAHYKVGYKVEIYKQDTDLEGYTKEEEDYVGYEYITSAAFTPNVEVTGFELAATQPTEGTAPAITSKVLTATPSENVFRLYYDRKLVEVTIAPNYPDGQAGTPIQRSVPYGCEVELPVAEFKADGYFLYAWSAMDAEGNTDIIESDYIKSLVVNAEGGDAEYSEIEIAGEYISFTALWNKGYTDMMRGVDRIYLFHEDDTVCYLERYGKYFEGEYTPSLRSAYFSYGEGESLEGRLRDDHTFIYGLSSRNNMSADFYSFTSGIDSNRRITLDSYDGLTYIAGSSLSRGTYTIDAENNYHVTFTTGDLSGQTLVLRMIQSTVDGATRTLFQFRNEDEYEMPILQRALVAEQNGTNVVTYLIDDLLSVDLDGYGGAVMNLGDDETSNYYYALTEETLTLYNTNGSVYGVCKFVTIDEKLCYIAYEAAMDVTYTASDGSTLKLDGVSEAVYQPKGAMAVRWNYTYTASIFGGDIVTVALDKNTRYVFLIKSETSGEGEEAVTTHTFEKKPNGYAEYYHTDGRYINFTPIIVINETAEGKASVYGASGTSSQHVFHKVAEGEYKYDAKQQTYALTIDKTAGITYPAGILETPIDLHDLEVIVFGVNITRTNTANYRVAYWQSVKRTGDEVENDLTTTYNGKVTRGSETVEAKLTLVGGFAILKIGTEDWKVGSYSTSNGVTTVNIGLTDTTSRFYVELNGDAKTFIHLNKLLGSARERNADGTSNSNVTFEFDGKGGATLVTRQSEGDPIRVAGTLTVQDDVEGVEGIVYQFTPTAGGDTEAFRFVLLVSGSSTYFTRETKDYNGTYTQTDGEGTLTLDGFGFRGTFTVAGEDEPLEGIYSIVDAENHIVRVMVGSDAYFFDITEREYKVRGSEYGAYMFVVNYANDGYLLRLDGYGNATLEKGEKGKDDYVVIQGKYSEEGGVYTLNLTIETEVAGINAEYKGALGWVTRNNTTYNAFLVEFSNARNIYVDRTEWTVLVLDGFGNAVRYGQYGAGESGTYTVLTDNLLYYENRAGSSACIYQYSGNEMVGEIVMRKYDAQSYYTEDLDALRFSEYGYMEFNEQTRYYYNIAENGNVTIYRRAFGETGANEYGFLPIEIGKLGTALDLSKYGTENFGNKTYYSANGYAITFKRATDDKYDETNFKYPVRLNEEDKNLYALENLVFAPTGGDTQVTATVRINNETYYGIVYRTVVEGDGTSSVQWYLTLGNYRFDIELHYQGAATATYKITKMQNIQIYQSNTFMDLYVLGLLMFSVQFRDTYGTITFVTEYDEQGNAGTMEKGTQYITSAFGKSSVLSGMNFEKSAYEFDEDTYIYSVKLPQRTTTGEEAPDTHQYRLYFGLQYNQSFALLGYRMAGYTIFAYTREEQLETDDGGTHYTVTTERVLYGETNAYARGSYYSIKLETGTEDKTEIAAPDQLLTVGDALYYVVYTHSEDETITIPTAATYYELKFTEQEGGSIAENEVKLLESVTVREITATVYSTDRGSYAEVITDEEGNKKIVHVYYSQDYTVATCEYDAESKTYTVTTTSGRRLSIKITDEESKTIEIAAITETQA